MTGLRITTTSERQHTRATRVPTTQQSRDTTPLRFRARTPHAMCAQHILTLSYELYRSLLYYEYLVVVRFSVWSSLAVLTSTWSRAPGRFQQPSLHHLSTHATLHCNGHAQTINRCYVTRQLWGALQLGGGQRRTPICGAATCPHGDDKLAHWARLAYISDWPPNVERKHERSSRLPNRLNRTKAFMPASFVAAVEAPLLPTAVSNVANDRPGIT